MFHIVKLVSDCQTVSKTEASGPLEPEKESQSFLDPQRGKVVLSIVDPERVFNSASWKAPAETVAERDIGEPNVLTEQRVQEQPDPPAHQQQ